MRKYYDDPDRKLIRGVKNSIRGQLMVSDDIVQQIIWWLRSFVLMFQTFLHYNYSIDWKPQTPTSHSLICINDIASKVCLFNSLMRDSFDKNL